MLLQSFIVGAVSVTALGITADRFGSKLAGALGGLPATIAVSLAFIGFARGGEQAAQATVPIPLMMGLFAVFICIYCRMIGRGLGIALLTAFVPWAALVVLAAHLPELRFVHSIVVFMFALVCGYFYLEHRLSIPATKGSSIRLSLREALARCLIGGVLVSSSVYIGAVGSPLLAGIMIACPAVTVSALIVTYRSGGPALSGAFAKSIMLSAMLNGTLYATAVRFLYPRMNVWLATGASIVVTVVGIYLLYLFIERKTK